MSTDLDALDRGVIDAGVIAAEALARAEAAEARCARLEARVRDLFAVMAEANGQDPAAGAYEGAAEAQARRRAMHAVGGAQ